MTRDEIIARIQALSDERFERIAPWLEADLAGADQLDDLEAEIEAGRRSAEVEPLLEHAEALARARRSLSKE